MDIVQSVCGGVVRGGGGQQQFHVFTATSVVDETFVKLVLLFENQLTQIQISVLSTLLRFKNIFCIFLKLFKALLDFEKNSLRMF